MQEACDISAVVHNNSQRANCSASIWKIVEKPEGQPPKLRDTYYALHSECFVRMRRLQ